MSFVRHLEWILKGRFARRPRGFPAHQVTDVNQAVKAFQRYTGITFTDTALLTRALTHRSFLGGESENLPASNERLEFLGDAVLELIVIEHLFWSYPDDREGDLTQKKSLLVSRSVLADRAEMMGLGKFVLLSPAEREAGGGGRHSILADAFEAILGAVYLDQGLRVATEFVERWLLQKSDSILTDTDKQNYKSILQERVQAALRVHPRYRIRREEGPDHHKRFTVEVTVRGTNLAIGRGNNKKEAEQQAARRALDSEVLGGLLGEEEG